MDISSSRFRFRSEYTLTVSAHRSFLGVLPKSTSVRQILPVTADPPTFVSNPSSLPTPPPSPSSTKLVHLAMSMSDDEMHTQDDYFREREASLPSYSPPPSSISHPRLQVITPGPLTLVREQDILLQLMVHLPQSLSGSGDVFLRSGTISLCQSVKVCMRPTPYHTTQSHMICSWDEPMKIQGETVLLDPSCFGGRLSTPGSVQPSYNSCLLRTESTLEIEVMISRGRQGKVQVSTTHMKRFPDNGLTGAF